MSGHSENEYPRRRRRRSFKGVHGVTRQVSEFARLDAYRLPIYLKVECPLDHVVSLVPVVPMRRWTEADWNLLLHQRPSSGGVVRIAEEPKWHPEDLEPVALARFDGDSSHRSTSFEPHERLHL